MGNNETKLYDYLTGALIVLILLLETFSDTYQSFATVVFCSLTMFLLLVGLFYYADRPNRSQDNFEPNVVTIGAAGKRCLPVCSAGAIRPVWLLKFH